MTSSLKALLLTLSLILGACTSTTGYPPERYDKPLPRGYHLHIYPLEPAALHAKCYSNIAIACTYPLITECAVYVRSDYRRVIAWLHTLRRHERGHCPHGDQPPWPADHPSKIYTAADILR